MSDFSWSDVIGPMVTVASVVVTVWISNRSMANQHKSEADRLTKELGEKVAVLGEKITGFSDRVSTFERHIQKQIDDIKIRMMELEKEVRREKSQR